MVTDLQKASLLKRTAAGIFDGILLCTLAVGFAWLLAALLNYNGCNAALQQEYARYESLYGVEFDISQEAYQALSEQQRQNYDAAYQALTSDEAVLGSYNLLLNLSLIITTFGILLAVLALEEKYRVPIHLHYYEGFSLAEIASMLRRPAATVGSQLARGRERLKKMLQEEEL